METRKLGGSHLSVSPLGLGCWAIGGPFTLFGQQDGWGDVDDSESIRAIRRAVELGVTLFDTADAYGTGHSEEVLGSALAAVFGIVGRFRSLGIDVEAGRGQIAFIVWGDLGALAAFALFVVRSIAKRNVAASHKRLMLLASISLMAPAFIRLSALPPFDALGGVLFTLAALLVTTGALVVHDLASRRSIHPETLWGVPCFLGLLLGGAFLLPGTVVDDWLLSRLW